MNKKLGLVPIAAAAIMMVAAATAWACTNLATLNLSESAVSPGQTLEVTGSSFRTAERGGQDVVFHWTAPDGPVLAQATPDATGQVSASVTVPADAAAGHYVLVATQLVAEQDGHVDAGGLSPAFGTPARASVQVGQPAPVEAPSASGTEVAATDGGSAALVALTILLALAGTGLFAAGLATFAREARSRRVPEAVRAKE